jgi:hypothetical protein
MITFDREQKNALVEGTTLREQLQLTAKQACDVESAMDYRHTFITGDPGLGKSYLVKKAAEESGIPFILVQGQASLFGMAQNYAVAKVKHWDEPVIVIIDDCDFMFTDSDSINTLKGMVGPDNVFAYSKNIHLNSIPEGAKRDAVSAFMSDDETGFRIPLDNFHFVFTSNAQLPTNRTVAEARKRSKGLMTSKIEKMDHLLAIRSRVNYVSVNTDKEGLWGSIAHVLLKDGGCPSISEQEKMMILDWMWNKWENMTETSVRTAEKMAEDLIRVGIENAKDRWAYNYLEL